MTLRDARKALGWTQQRLAAEAQVAQQQISELENNQIGRVSHEAVVKIVRAFHRAGLKGVSSDDLFPVASERA